jgi:pimeloyl-ACP methyl ester carboxylesterase
VQQDLEGRLEDLLETAKAHLRAKVKHPFRVIKRQFGFQKTRYRGIKKHNHKLKMLFALGSFSSMEADPRVYRAMCGTSEFNVTGSLRDWDRSDRLHLIQQPTLVISGQYDEATPKVAGFLHQGIAHSEWELMADCLHLCHLEQTERYLERVNTFLDKVESNQQAPC